MQRLTPYLFFIIAALGLAMVAVDQDQSWQTEEVDTLDAIIVIAGVFIGAHLLRKLAGFLHGRMRDREQ